MENKDVYELTNPQKSIWYMEEFFKGSNINNICGNITINETVDFKKLKDAINIFIHSNDCFNIRILLDNNVPKQYLCEFGNLDFDIININSKDEIISIEKEMVSQTFNIIDSPLFAFKLFKLPNGHGGVVMNIHHIISDAATIAIISTGVAKIYSNLMKNFNLDIETSSYIDYINSEKNYLKSEKFKKDEQYWNEKFETIPEVASLPSSLKNKNTTYSSDSKRISFVLNKNIVDKIRELCSKEKISVYNFFMALYSLYIGKVSNLDDFVIGTPILNRTNFKEKHTPGMFISNVPFRINLDDNLTFNNFVSNIANDTLGMLRHQKYPYQYLLKNLRKKYDSIPNLYDIIISYQITKTVDKTIDLPYTASWFETDKISCGINIHIHDNDDSGNLTMCYDYLIDKYSPEDINSVHNRILHIVDQLLTDIDLSIKDIEIVTPEEKNKILYEFNNTYADYPTDKTVIDLFEEQVEKTPNNVAVVCNDKSLTYKELNSKANQLANYLRNSGIKPKEVVAIRMPKCLEMIVGILSIMKIGATYLPINLSYPEERVNFMIKDSNASHFLLCSKMTDLNVSIPTIDISFQNEKIYTLSNKNLENISSPEDTIYIIYTSGSTGTPKGAMIMHKNVVSLLKNNKFLFDFNDTDVWTMFHSVAFDFSVWEMYGALLYGGKLVLVPEDIAQDPNKFLNLLRKEKVTVLNQTPTYFYNLQNAELKLNDSNLKIRYIIFGGEALKPNAIKSWKEKYNNTKLINMYGITETTVHVTFKELSNVDLSLSTSNIGKPIPTLKVYILDKYQKLLPPGIAGEICVTGAGVFKGYLNRPDLNQTKLISNPYNQSEIMYRSGDSAILNYDGTLEYCGRIDSQIKIRGFRVELGEIEEKILNLPNITSCVVAKKTDQFQHDILCAYYIKNGPVDISKIKSLLHKDLAPYMVPQYFIELEHLPYNHNGKINRNILPLPNIVQNKNIIHPRNNIDKTIIDILVEILHVDNISIDDSFIDLGGDSLSAINFSSILSEKLNVTITVKDILTQPIISDLSDFIAKAPNHASFDNTIIPTEVMEDYPLSSAQKRIYYASKMIGDKNVVYNVTGAVLIDNKIDKENVKLAFSKIIEHHETFRTSFYIKNGEVRQKIKKLNNFDVSIFTGDSNDIDNIILSFKKPFDLEKDLLIRVALCYLNNGKTLLLIDSHHIVLDGLSLHILFDEFCKFYQNKPVSKLDITYKDFAVWEDSYINSKKIKKHEDYWINKFINSDLPSINLPYDYAKSINNSYEGNTIRYSIDNEFFNSYIEFAKKLNVSPYILFMSVFLILLYKYTSQDEIIIGSPTIGREISQLKNIIGTFVNNIVIDAKMRDNQQFTDFIKYIKNQVLDDLNNQIYPYDMLVKKISNLNNSHLNSLFDVAFVYQGFKDFQYSIDNKNLTFINPVSNTSKFTLTLTIDANFKTIDLEYNTNLFKEETIKGILEHYIFTLESLLNNENILIRDIDILPPKEYDMLNSFNNTFAEINDDTFITIFEKQVYEHPNDIALICNDKFLSYDELNKKANSLSHLLIESGIKPNDIICIMTNRSFETIICMIAILKAGAAFFNVDPTYPIERTKYYIENSKTKYVLTQSELKDKVQYIENCIEIDLDNNWIYEYDNTNPNIKTQPNDLSYLIYTSGSTGLPKGVMLTQIGLANMVKAMLPVLEYLKEGNKHTIASVTSTPFDIFVYEIVVSLAYGLKIVMANNAEHRNPKLLDSLIKKYNVDVMTVTPSLMKINYDNREPNSALALVKNMVFGGEPLPEKFVKDLKSLADDITIYNIYGPSEITVLSNVQNLNNEKEITVGPPIMNTQIHILDKNMKRVPIGVVGEIYISGIQVGLGYMGKPELTAERFIKNPFGTGKIYKTGDIGRWTFDGKVQCLGRVDNQIKLRGLRIELSEIENIMLNIKGISSAIVNKIEIDEKEVLCGYYVADSSIKETMVKDTLRNSLPYYMVPTYIIRLEKMPYTINRKIDRKALPLPELHKSLSHNKININELNSNEEKLLQIWKNILKIDDIDINDNFFDIGGDSISAINMQIEAVKYGLNFEYADIFNYPTISQLSNKLPSPESSFMENYDYSHINNLLKRNTFENIKSIKPFSFKNILLIGATGYLGAHVLNEFLKNCAGTIYCLIRPKNNINIEKRLKDTLKFYFGQQYNKEFNNRIKIIEGDIIKRKLGLSSDDYNLLANNIDAVINCGALVKHFGQKQLFEDINVTGTQNIVDFCFKNSKRLLHISTMSISGNGEKEEFIEETIDNINNKKVFKESDIYIGQNIKGIYTTTKYKAELIILESILKGLDAQILRVGNITNRFSDGVFQINAEDNAFAKRFKSFIDIGAIPKYLLDHAIELTPVDLCANAIIHILKYTSNCNVLHLYNDKLLDIKLLFNTLNNLGYAIVPVSNQMMTDIINGILQDDSRKELLSGIIHDINSDKKLIYTSRIRLNCEFSNKYLSTIGFSWKQIDSEYIKKYVKYLKKINYIK